MAFTPEPSTETAAVDGEEKTLGPQLATTDLCRHLALFYRSKAEQFASVSAYVSLGIDRGEQVVYVVDDNTEQTVVDALNAAGLPVDSLRESGRLQFVDGTAVYGQGTLVPDECVATYEEVAREALADGYEGLWVAGENTWSFGLDCGFDRIMEFEAVFDSACPDIPVTALCQYSLDRFTDAEVGKALQTHEQIIYRGQLCENPYYVHPEDALEGGPPMSNATLLLEQTRDVDQFQSDVESREQRLSVVNRVLRHNLRNEVNVIVGRLEHLRNEGLVRAEGVDQLDTVRDAARRLLDLAERARHVDRTLDSVDRTQAPLDRIVDTAVEEGCRRSPDATVTVDVDQNAVVADGAFRLALSALVDVATTATDGGTIHVTSIDDGRDDTVSVEVSTAETFVPAPAREALTRGTEAALRHTTGLGLWVTNWVVEEARGTMEFPGEGAANSVRLTVPTVPSAVE